MYAWTSTYLIWICDLMYVIYIHQHHVPRLHPCPGTFWEGFTNLGTFLTCNSMESIKPSELVEWSSVVCRRGSRGELVNPLTINHTHKSWSWNEKLAKESGVLWPKWFRSNIEGPVAILGILWLNQMWANVAFDSSQPYQDLVTITTLPPHPANITDGKRSSTCSPLPPARLRASAKRRKDIQNSVSNVISRTKTINSCNISATNTTHILDLNPTPKTVIPIPAEIGWDQPQHQPWNITGFFAQRWLYLSKIQPTKHAFWEV